MKAPPAPPQFTDASHLKVGDVRIELRHHRIVRPDQRIELPQRMFDLLLVFLAEPGVLHTRKDLFRRLWPDVVVEDSNLSQSVWMLRKALGDERKHWIRTVSKNGYIFEPPGLIEVIADHTSAVQIADSQDPIECGAPAQSTEAPATQTRMSAQPGFLSRHRARISARLPLLLTMMFAMVIALTSSSGNERRDRRHAGSNTVPVMVTILQQAPVSSGDDKNALQWPVDLLEEWLSWKLDVLPEVIRLQKEDVSAGNTPATMRSVVLSTEYISGSSDTVVLRARLGGNENNIAVDTLIVRGAVGDVPSMIDTLTQQIMTRLLPLRADAEWPALRLDAGTAEHYANAAAAIRRRDWDSAVEGMQATIRAAPDFGMAHLRLAEVDLRRGQISQSLAHIAKARRNFTPIPQDAARILDAYTASFDPRRQLQAMEAYRSLTRDYPERPDFAFTHARLLTRAGRPQEALDILSGHRWQWSRRTPSTRIHQNIVLSETELAMGYPARARRTAQQALHLIGQAGNGWELERGAVRLLLARAHHNEPGMKRSPALFELAAQSFDAAGDSPDALYARYLAEYARTSPGNAMSARMQALLAEARSHGYAQLEIELLRRAAYQHYNAGQHDMYRAFLQQALHAANASGDIAQQRILDLDLLNEDMMIGNQTSAEARIERLLGNTIPGEKNFWVIQFDAAILMQKGHYREALEHLTRNELAATDHGKMPAPELSSARLTCLRVDILIAKGDVNAARGLLDHCRNPEEPFVRLSAQLSEAAADILDDDLAHARVILNDVEQTLTAMPNSVDRWLASMTAASLLVRSGEYERASRLCTAALPAAEKAGYSLLVAHLETGLAEIAAARRDWKQSRQLSDAARSRVAHDNWALTNRLDTLEVVDALSSGNTQAAATRIAGLRMQAGQFEDAVVVAQMDHLAAMLPTQMREVSVPPRPSKRPLRGATLDWLITMPNATRGSGMPAVAIAN